MPTLKAPDPNHHGFKTDYEIVQSWTEIQGTSDIEVDVDKCSDDSDDVDFNQLLSHCVGVKTMDYNDDNGAKVQIIMMTGTTYCAPCKWKGS